MGIKLCRICRVRKTFPHAELPYAKTCATCRVEQYTRTESRRRGECTEIGICVHCHKRKVASRGLCRRCWSNPVVKAQHPARQGQGGGRPLLVPDYEPTQDELDKMVAEQLQCLPVWWDKDTQEENGPYYTRPLKDDEDRTYVTDKRTRKRKRLRLRDIIKSDHKYMW